MIYYGSKETHAKNIVSGCVVRSEQRIDILNAKSIGKKYLNVIITEPFIFGVQQRRSQGATIGGL